MIRKVLAALFLVTMAQSIQAQDSPYTSFQGREIKALSPERVASLLAGEGAGYALAAELNGYPGPRHVLDLADSLSLTDEQRARVGKIFHDMQTAARALGRRIVAGEATLDTAFADGTIDAGRLEESLAELARLEGELRRVHLAAHLEVTAVLSRHQVQDYERLRGYGSHSGHQHDGAGMLR